MDMPDIRVDDVCCIMNEKDTLKKYINQSDYFLNQVSRVS